MAKHVLCLFGYTKHMTTTLLVTCCHTHCSPPLPPLLSPLLPYLPSFPCSGLLQPLFPLPS